MTGSETGPGSPSGGVEDVDVVVVGAGVAGLRCAHELVAAGREVVVHEAGDDVGGRIRTDEVDGFLLDRGFQLLNPAYPAVRRWVDVGALDLGSFGAGVAARTEDRLVRLGHPVREPGLVPATLRALATRPGEVAALARWAAPLATAVRHGDELEQRLGRRPDSALAESLDAAGVDGMLRRVLDRFFAGVLLSDDGRTSTHFALLLTWMFLTGVPGLPAAGMQAFPRQLARGLDGRVRLRSEVLGIDRVGAGFAVRTSTETTRARSVVVATDTVAATGLLGGATPRMHGVVTQWWAADAAPTAVPLLHVDAAARTRGPLVNAAVMSSAQPTYAPPGRHLVQGSALLPEGATGPSEAEMRAHAGHLLGASTDAWIPLRRDEVRRALPVQAPPLRLHRPLTTDTGVVVCGDHSETASIQGALVSGHRAALAAAAQVAGLSATG